MSHVVITHPEWGIFLGNFLGLAIWSKLDACGQEAAVCFESAEEAQRYMATWSDQPGDVVFAPVVPDMGAAWGAPFASLAAIHRAGLETWLDSAMECQGSVQ